MVNVRAGDHVVCGSVLLRSSARGAVAARRPQQLDSQTRALG